MNRGYDKQHYVELIKNLAKYLENKAEDIVEDMDYERIKDIYITTLIEPNCISTWNISKEYYVIDNIEKKQQALNKLKEERESE